MDPQLDPVPDPDPLVRSTDPRIRNTAPKMSRIPNTLCNNCTMTGGDAQGGVAGGARLSASQRHHGHEGDAGRRILGRHPQAGDEPQAPRGRPGEAPALRPRLAAQALHRLAQHSHVRVRCIIFFYRARVSLGVSVKHAMSVPVPSTGYTFIKIHFLQRVKPQSTCIYRVPVQSSVWRLPNN